MIRIFVVSDLKGGCRTLRAKATKSICSFTEIVPVLNLFSNSLYFFDISSYVTGLIIRSGLVRIFCLARSWVSFNNSTALSLYRSASSSRFSDLSMLTNETKFDLFVLMFE
eukprot:Lithocolla_globosa_v1_NODE_664_length_3481_cov_56.430239.p4 type:complete len:111 gc:universal NODE_664_length_3481_cov_56.430239:3016-3348(+)